MSKRSNTTAFRTSSWDYLPVSEAELLRRNLLYCEGVLYKRQKIDLNKNYPIKDLSNPSVPVAAAAAAAAATTSQVIDLTVSDSDADDEAEEGEEEEEDFLSNSDAMAPGSPEPESDVEEVSFSDDVPERVTSSDEETEFVALSTDASSSSFEVSSSTSSSSSSEEEVDSTAGVAEEAFDLMSEPEGTYVEESDFVVGDDTVSVVEESDMGETCFPDPEVEGLLDFMSPAGSPVSSMHIDNNSLYGIPHDGTGTASENDPDSEEEEVSPLAHPVNPSEHATAFAEEWTLFNASDARPVPADMIYFVPKNTGADTYVDVEALADEFFTA